MDGPCPRAAALRGDGGAAARRQRAEAQVDVALLPKRRARRARRAVAASVGATVRIEAAVGARAPAGSGGLGGKAPDSPRQVDRSVKTRPGAAPRGARGEASDLAAARGSSAPREDVEVG